MKLICIVLSVCFAAVGLMEVVAGTDGVMENLTVSLLLAIYGELQ